MSDKETIDNIESAIKYIEQGLYNDVYGDIEVNENCKGCFAIVGGHCKILSKVYENNCPFKKTPQQFKADFYKY